MKHLKLTGFIIFFFSLAESLALPTKPKDVVHFNATQKFIEKNIAYLTIIAFAQYVQEASFDEVDLIVKGMMDHRDACLADSTLPECSKSSNEAMWDRICITEGLPQKYGLSHCCNEHDIPRRLCFFNKKKANVGFLAPFPTLDPEEKCQAYKNNREAFLNHYMYEAARRNTFAFAPVLLNVAARFEEAATECCEQQQKATCFQAKAAPITQYLKASSSFQRNICGAFIKFGPKVLKSINIAAFSKVFPKIGFEDLISLLVDVSSMYGECCEGDVVQCVRSQSQTVNHICSKQDSISSEIKECCEKETPERENCISYAKTDSPRDLSPREPKFTDSENVCQERDSNQDFFAEFTYEYSRRHLNVSIVELLRITKAYTDLLADCCSRETPVDCYCHAEDKFSEETERTAALIRQECGRFQSLGKDATQLHYLAKFTKVAPQLSMEELASFSKEMVTALATSCTPSVEFASVEYLAQVVLGDLCGISENRTINPAVDHCCNTDYPFRRPCFEHLKADRTYALPSVSELISALRADWCQAQNEELQHKKQRFLVNLVKWMPEVTDEEILCLLTKFTAAEDACGEVKEPEACFNPQSPKTGEENQAA